MKTEAQKAANKRYYDKRKGELATWGPKFKREEIAKIDEVLKAHNMNKAEFIRWAVDKLESEGK